VFSDLGASQEANAVLVQPDGKLVVGGGRGANFGQPGQTVLARFNADGSRDMTFGTQGLEFTDFSAFCGFIRTIRALALQPDGKIVAAVLCQDNPTGDRFLVARFNANGSLDTSFGAGDGVATPLEGGVSVALALQAGGKIVAAGSTESTFAVVRLNPGGTLDTTFSGDGRVPTSRRSVPFPPTSVEPTPSPSTPTARSSWRAARP